MDTLTLRFRQHAFQVVAWVSLLLFVFCLVLGIMFGNWLSVLLIGVPSLVVPFFLYKLLGDHPLA
ncbi:MAG: hypothetical protein B7Z18_11670 [Alishewanella sp. 32-51-5]|nr:MAG: hypothetical protein B7Z18_11670 [Alishewanella sp. 32-51-5]